MILKMAKSVEMIEEEGQELFKIIASEAVMDRDREIMLPSAWDLSIYKTHPVILDRHLNENMRMIGESVDVENTGEQLLLDVKYWNNAGNPYADWCYFIAKNRMAAFSVGFTPKEWTEDAFSKEFKEAKQKGLFKDERPIRIFTKVVLDEVSQVAIPSLQTALQKNANLNIDEVLEVGGKVYPEEADLIKWQRSDKKSYVIPLIERMNRLDEEYKLLQKEFYASGISQKAMKKNEDRPGNDDVKNEDEQINETCEKVFQLLKG